MFFRPGPPISLALAGVLAACNGEDAPGSGTTGTDPSTTGMTTASTLVDGSTTTGTGGDTGTSTGIADSSTGTPACPDTHACVHRAPEGWNGPALHFADASAEMAAACPSAYPEVDVMGGADLVAPPASCTCSCADATDVTCEVQATLRFHGADNTCSSPNPASFQFFTTLCNTLPQLFQANSWWVVDPIKVTGGSCTPGATVDVAPAVFTTTGTLCGGSELLDASCDTNRVCAPSMDGAEVCIWQPGDSECPATYDVRYLYHTEIVDDRSCAECSCDDPVGLCDDASMLMFQNVCNPPISGVLQADGECHGTVLSTQSVAFDPGTPSAFCEPSLPTATGAAAGGTPFTVCCDA